MTKKENNCDGSCSHMTSGILIGFIFGMLFMFIIFAITGGFGESAQINQLGQAICSEKSNGTMDFDKVEDIYANDRLLYDYSKNITVFCKPKPIEQKYDGIKIRISPIGTPTIGTIGKLIGYYLECNFNIVNNFTEKEKKIFCLGRATSEFAPISERIIFPATVNITYDKFNIIKTYKTVSDFPLADDCYNETICYVEWH